MKKEEIKKITGNFESFAQQMDNGIEFWFARDLQHLFGYTKWDNFLNVISKAKTSKEEIKDHFADVRKMVKLGYLINYNKIYGW